MVKRFLTITLIVILAGSLGAVYMMLEKTKQQAMQCQEDMQNLNTQQTQINSDRETQLEQLRTDNKALKEQSAALTEKARDLVIQSQQQIEKLQKENQDLAAANQALKQRSEAKIAALAQDLRQIQNEQKTLKQQYADKTSAAAAKSAVLRNPVKAGIQAKQPMVQGNTAGGIVSQPEPVKPTTTTPSANKNLSLNFPQPGTAAVPQAAYPADDSDNDL